MKRLLRRMITEIARSLLSIYQPRIIAVTGSVGKTSTKQAIGALLAASDPTTRVAQGSFNTDWGVPLTIIGGQYPAGSPWKWLRVLARGVGMLLWHDSSYPKTIVLELGADRPGDIARLARWVRPHVGVVTSISAVHLEKLRTIQHVAKEKLSLLSALPANGSAIVNSSVARSWDVKGATRARMTTAGIDSSADVFATDVSIRVSRPGGAPGRGTFFKLHWNGSVVPCTLVDVAGWAVVESSCMAAAVGLSQGMNLIAVSDALKRVEWPAGRMRILDGIRNSILIDDSYNASPKAVLQAVNVLEYLGLNEGRTTWTVLGDMADLGAETESAHRDVGKTIAEKRPGALVVVGINARFFASEAIAAGFPPERVYKMTDAWEAGRFLQENIREGDVILVKGSQVMRMERVVKELMAKPLEAAQLLVRQQWWWR
ncbi:UDP-N-acetylmuramoyl-tripeptide--D-alanyl-D-alanine ligase [Candidatus Uhrbacteria bacterium]|nr:UDP-N-acetylmuramoyl-tripeptide--D-alanyl-D-alanine ligase [Candidatus Uhrbacteria bacterium]